MPHPSNDLVKAVKYLYQTFGTVRHCTMACSTSLPLAAVRMRSWLYYYQKGIRVSHEDTLRNDKWPLSNNVATFHNLIEGSPGLLRVWKTESQRRAPVFLVLTNKKRSLQAENPHRRANTGELNNIFFSNSYARRP